MFVRRRRYVFESLQVGRLIVEVDGNCAVLAGRFGSLSHETPSVKMAVGVDEPS